jgi:DNA-binding winged helix-turn-helix (wHTH) protein/TolB-like protein
MKVGDWTVTPARNLLDDGTRSIKIEPRTMELLVYLARRAGQVVSADDLVREVWHGRVFDDGIVYNKITQLRKALGDHSRVPRFIETIPKRGYRLVARVVPDELPVTGAEPAEVKPATSAVTPTAPVRQRNLLQRYAPPSRALRLATVGIGFAALATVVTVMLQNIGATSPDATVRITELQAPPGSIAVLPCEDLSPEPRHAYFAPAIHVQILDRLANLSGLNVFSPETVRRFGSEESAIPDVVRELSVDYVATCSVLYTGSRVRLMVQLFDSATGRVRMSETYDGDPANTQAELATDVARAVQLTLSEADLAALEKVSTETPEAYALFLQALMTGFPQSVEYLDRAIAFDPRFATAYGRKAVVHALEMVNNTMAVPLGTRSTFQATAFENAEKAFSIDPVEPWAMGSRALTSLYTWRWDEARRIHEEIVRTRPNGPNAFRGYSWFTSFTGDHKTAAQLSRRRLQADRSPNAYYSLGRVLVWGRDGEGAAQACDEAIRLQPAFPEAFLVLGEANVQRGRVVEAEAAFRTSEALFEGRRSGAPGLAAPELIWGYGAVGARADAARLHLWLEQWAQEFEVGAGDWALASIGVGDYAAARQWLEHAVAKVEAHELEPGFYSLMMIKANPFGDRELERSPFRELRAQLDGFE